MLGLFGMFGRSEGLKALDQSLREFDIHPRTVPEAVKIMAVKLLQAAPSAARKLHETDYASAAELLAYTILGHDQFAASTTLSEATRAENRLDEAIAAGDGLDADLILLALHAGIINAEIADRFDIETSE